MKNTSKKTIYKKMDAKKYKARMRRIKRFLLFILVITSIVLFARSSFFMVDKIKVEGNKKYNADDVIKQTGLVTGFNVFKMLGEKPKNLFSFRFNEAENSILKAMPYIKTVRVSPSLPDKIKIRIQERTPFAVLETNGTSLLIDKEGYVLEELKDSKIKDKYFKIIGNSVDRYNLGQSVKFKGRSPLNELIDFCAEINKNDKDSKLKLYKEISEVNLSETNNIVVVFGNRITVKFGDLDDIEYKIRFFRQLYVNNITEKQKGTLDFTKGGNPYFVLND